MRTDVFVWERSMNHRPSAPADDHVHTPAPRPTSGSRSAARLTTSSSSQARPWLLAVVAAAVCAAAPAEAQGSMKLMVGDGVSAEDARLLSSYFELDAEKLGFAPTGKNGEGADVRAAAVAAARSTSRDIVAGRLTEGASGLTLEVVVVGQDGAVYATATADLADAEDRKSLRKALAKVVSAYRKRPPTSPAPTPPAPTPAPVLAPAPPAAVEKTPETSPQPPPAAEPSPGSKETPAASVSAPEGSNPWVTPLALLGSAVGLAGAAVGVGMVAQSNVDAIRDGRAEDIGSARVGAIVGATASDALTTAAIGVGVVGVVAVVMVAVGFGAEGPGTAGSMVAAP